jgi:hypothetical protein
VVRKRHCLLACLSKPDGCMAGKRVMTGTDCHAQGKTRLQGTCQGRALAEQRNVLSWMPMPGGRSGFLFTVEMTSAT